MTLRFGVFDHIEPVPGLRLDRIYRERLLQIERLDTAGFYAYHLAEHHTPAIHSLAFAERLPRGRRPTHPAPALRPLRLRPAAAPPAASDRRDQHARPPQ